MPPTRIEPCPELLTLKSAPLYVQLSLGFTTSPARQAPVPPPPPPPPDSPTVTGTPMEQLLWYSDSSGTQSTQAP